MSSALVPKDSRVKNAAYAGAFFGPWLIGAWTIAEPVVRFFVPFI